MKRIKGEKCNLSDLRAGQVGEVLEINIKDKTLKRHLLEMGLVRSTIVKIKKVAPLGDPVVIALRGYELFVEKNNLERSIVKVL